MTTDTGSHVSARWAGPFFTVWSGQAFSLLGSELVQFALVWFLTKATGSATVLAMATLVALLPQIFLGPLAGALVDRWSRRTVMIVSDSLIALATLGLSALYALKLVEVWHIYVLLIARSAGGVFQRPAMQASTTMMVPKEHFSRVQGINQTLQGALVIVSPALGALLLDLLPMQGILAIDVSTALFAVLPLLFIPIPQPQATALDAEEPEQTNTWRRVLRELREGLAYVRGSRGLVLIMATSVLSNVLLTPAVSLLPLMVADHFGGGAVQLAWLHSAWGAGMITGGLVLASWGGFRRRMVTTIASSALMGLGLIAFGLVPSNAIVYAIIAVFFSGVMNTIGNGSFTAVLQSVVPAAMQGRVFSLVASLLTATIPLGLAVAGPVSDAAGVPLWFLVGGIAETVMATVSFFIPAIMHIEDSPCATTTARDALRLGTRVAHAGDGD